MVTLSPPTSEAWVRFPARPQVEKLAVGRENIVTFTNIKYTEKLVFFITL